MVMVSLEKSPTSFNVVISTDQGGEKKRGGGRDNANISGTDSGEMMLFRDEQTDDAILCKYFEKARIGDFKMAKMDNGSFVSKIRLRSDTSEISKNVCRFVATLKKSY